MILKRLVVESFGGLSGRTVDLEPGLNVILGPNETGKSTIYHAIQHTLLTPSSPGRRRFQGELARFIPVGGGDTISCRIEFSHEGRTYSLRRSWGAAPAVELRLPDGARIADEGNAGARLQELLPVREGTLKNVLMTYQAGLPDTLQTLAREREPVHSLSDLLRRSVLETDGVSVSRFRERLASRLEEYFAHWDSVRRRPENNREIDNPYQRGVGRILAAYYQVQRLRRSLARTRAAEEEFVDLHKTLERRRTELDRARVFLSRNEEAAESARMRQGLEQRAEGLAERLEMRKRDYERWTERAADAARAGAELPEVKGRLANLQQEKADVEAAAEREELMRRLGRVEVRRSRLQEARRRLAEVRAVSQDQLLALQSDLSAVENGRTTLAASGSVTVRMKAARPLTVRIRTAGGEAEQRDIGPEEELEVRSEGEVRIEHADWTVESSPGDRSRRQRIDELARSERALSERLEALGVSDVEEAKEAGRLYEQRRSEAAAAESSLAAELDGETYEELEARAGEAAKAAPLRSREQVYDALARTTTRAQELTKLLDGALEELGRLETAYGNRDGLLDAIAALKAERDEIRSRIEGLAPVPDGYADAEAFLEEYERVRGRADELRSETEALGIRHARAEERLPDESAEETETRLEEAEAAYRRELATGEALRRVETAAEGITGTLDGRAMAGFERTVAGFVRDLTGGRYDAVSRAADGADAGEPDGIPDLAVRSDGTPLPYTLLSAGTRDAFTLALKLGMAERFLRDREGFVVMDDPLVDMDPDRQERAAGLIARFAAGSQVLLFTCHPSHAALFGERPTARLTLEAPETGLG